MKYFVIKNKNTVITILLLSAIYLAFMLIAPRLTIWSYSFTYDPSDSVYTDLEAGDEYALCFRMSYDKINGIELLFQEGETGLGNRIVPIDATLELSDSNGDIILSKHITSIYDTSLNSGYLPVNHGDLYTLRFKINDVDAQESDTLPQLKAASESSFSFRVFGCHNGAPYKSLFSAAYAVFSAIIILYVYSLTSTSEELKSIAEKMLLLGISLVSILFLGQALDMEMISRAALKMIESLKAGNFLDYYNYSYSSALASGADFIHLGYNYDFFLILPVAVILFPISFFIESDMPYSQGYYAITVVLTIIVFLVLLLSSKLIESICKTCDMSSEYTNTVERLFLFSPVVICISLTFGQIDIFYVAVILSALIFYYKGNYRTFTLIMSVATAMKLFPLMIFIPLILLVKKKPLELIGHGVLVLIVPLISILLFKHGSGYDAIMSLLSSTYDFTGGLFNQTLGGSNAIFPIAYAFILLYAYNNSSALTTRCDTLKYSMILIFISYAAFTAFTSWHFQWLIPLSLSLAFLIPFYPNKRIILILGVLMELFLMLYVTGDERISVYEINFLLPVLFDYEYHGLFVSEIFGNINEHLHTLVVSLTTASLAALCYYFIKEKNESIQTVDDMALIKRVGCLKILSLYAIVILFIWCYCYVG